MSYTPTEAGQKLKDAASVKLLVYFKDGNKRTWYGRPNASNYTPVDPRELEIKRLQRWAETNRVSINVAIIYDLNSGQELARMKNGSWS